MSVELVPYAFTSFPRNCLDYEFAVGLGVVNDAVDHVGAEGRDHHLEADVVLLNEVNNVFRGQVDVVLGELFFGLG